MLTSSMDLNSEIKTLLYCLWCCNFCYSESLECTIRKSYCMAQSGPVKLNSCF